MRREGQDEHPLEEGAPLSPQPKWFTPLRLLLIFCITNLFVYLDRGVFRNASIN